MPTSLRVIYHAGFYSSFPINSIAGGYKKQANITGDGGNRWSPDNLLPPKGGKNQWDWNVKRDDLNQM